MVDFHQLDTEKIRPPGGGYFSLRGQKIFSVLWANFITTIAHQFEKWHALFYFKGSQTEKMFSHTVAIRYDAPPLA